MGKELKDFSGSFRELARLESSMVLKKLGQRCQEVGISSPELDQRLHTTAGYHVRLFAGELPFHLEDAFAVLYVLREDPGTFFAEVIPPNDQGDFPGLKMGLRQPS